MGSKKAPKSNIHPVFLTSGNKLNLEIINQKRTVSYFFNFNHPIIDYFINIHNFSLIIFLNFSKPYILNHEENYFFTLFSHIFHYYNWI